MQLSPTLAWLIDHAAGLPTADRLLAELGTRLVAERLPLAGGALTLEVPDPLVARRTWLWRSDNGEVIEALGFGGGGPLAAEVDRLSQDPIRQWLSGIAEGAAHEDSIGPNRDRSALAWIGPRPFAAEEVDYLRQVARFAAAPLTAIAGRATLTAALEAYLGRRSAARVLAAPLRRNIAGETIQAALLYADLRGFTALSEANPPAVVIAALDAWFDRVAGAVHAFGGEVLKFIGDGILAIFPVGSAGPREASNSALRAASAAQAGMQYLNANRLQQKLPQLSFGIALHLGEILWGNIGAADRLDFTAIGPSVNLVSRLEGLCRPLGKTILASGALAAATDAPLVLLGTHALRGIADPCEVFTLAED